jgi:hypothetical protein
MFWQKVSLKKRKKLTSLNTFTLRVTETILQGVTLALSFLTMQRYKKSLEKPNFLR